MRKLICALPFVFGMVMNVGCTTWEGVNTAKPETRAEFDPVKKIFKFRDSKDNDVQITGLEVSKEGGKVNSLTIRNNASDVRRANAVQMDSFTNQIIANWQGATMFVGAIVDLAREVAPWVPKTIMAKALGKTKSRIAFNSPTGGFESGSGLDPGQLDALVDLAGSALPGSRPAQ
jgi:hypothetical protein